MYEFEPLKTEKIELVQIGSEKKKNLNLFRLNCISYFDFENQKVDRLK